MSTDTTRLLKQIYRQTLNFVPSFTFEVNDMARKLKRKTGEKKAIRRDGLKKIKKISKLEEKKREMCMSAVQCTESTSVRRVDMGTGLAACT